MARKTMACKEAPEIELQFDGGEAILLRFDIRCLVNLQESDGGMKNFVKKNVVEMASEIIYAAGKDINDNFDKERACALVASMSLDNILEIIKTFEDSVGATGSDEESKKLVAQILAK